MKNTRRQLITFACILFLQMAVFATQAHATEHPFHVHGQLCDSFINFGQQDISVDTAAVVIVGGIVSIDVKTDAFLPVLFSFRPVYSSRAPPASLLI